MHHALQLRTILGITLVASATSLALHGADAMATPRWLDVGATVPAVTVLTTDGTAVDLREATIRQPTVLIFYRGGWCPYCNAHLGELATVVADLQAAGFQLLAISPDRPEKLYDAPQRKEQPTYTLLSDQDAKAMDAFGLSFVVPDELVAKYKSSYQIDLEADSGRAHHKLPHPAVYVVTDGVIRFAHVNEDYRKRLDPGKILAAARAAAEPGM
jgi:peroxiredoxin